VIQGNDEPPVFHGAACSDAHGTVWRANFFKCGGITSRPDWLAWAKMNLMEAAFHLPEDFGHMLFQ
jgi:hypothetical protein